MLPRPEPPEPDTALHLDVADLACRRGGRLVFAGLGFTLAPGEAIVVTGPNGAGKSTLLAALAGFVRPAEGRIATSGLGDRGRGECLHLLSHRDALKATLSAAENLAGAAAILGPGTGAPLPARGALARVGLAGAADLPAGHLSAGQRRRVALARLLVAPRPLWLLDEPTTALDAAGQALVLDLIASHRAGGGAVVATTHAPLPLPGARELSLGPAP